MKEQLKQYVIDNNDFMSLERLQMNSMLNRLINEVHGVEIDTEVFLMLAMSGYLVENIPIPSDGYDALRDKLQEGYEPKTELSKEIMVIVKRFVDDNCTQSSQSLVSDLLILLSTEKAWQTLTPTKDLI